MRRVRAEITDINGARTLDVRSAANFLGMTEDSLRARVARGTIPYRKLGGRVIFLRIELERFMADLPGVTVEAALEAITVRNGGWR